MDMNVNTDAFSAASSSLGKHCRMIETMTDVFMRKLASVRSEFDDVNYDRTVMAAISVKTQITAFSQNVYTLQSDLKKLEALVLDYTNGGYGR